MSMDGFWGSRSASIIRMRAGVRGGGGGGGGSALRARARSDKHNRKSARAAGKVWW